MKLKIALPLFLMVFMMPLNGQAKDAIAEAQQVEIDALRAQVAHQLQLSAYNLLDELVYGWTQSPPFTTPTHVILAEATAPIGFGPGLEALLETHLSDLLVKNTHSKIILTHCPACTAVVMHSTPRGTLVSRGYDQPEALEKLQGTQSKHALFVDIEAEGSWLVLRARITKLEKDLPIVWARTISTSGSTPSLLRSPNSLKSAAEARQEYMDALRENGPLNVPLHFTVQAFAEGENNSQVAPLIWLQTGIELSPSQARAWRASFLIGYSWIPEAYDGLMVQTRISRLISGTSRSLTTPDLYLFFGGSLRTVYGPAVVNLTNESLDTIQLLSQLQAGTNSRSTFGSWQLGFELRVNNRIGANVFLETIPTYSDSPNLGNFYESWFADFQSLGVEVTFCF